MTVCLLGVAFVSRMCSTSRIGAEMKMKFQISVREMKLPWLMSEEFQIHYT